MPKYVVTFENVAYNAPQDAFEVVAGTGKPLVIHACFITQHTDAGDAQDEQIRVRCVRGHTQTGSSGLTPTIAPLGQGRAAALFTAKTNCGGPSGLSVATGGSPLVLHPEGFNIRAGWPFLPTPEIRHEVQPGERYVVNLPGIPTGTIRIHGALYVEE